MAHADVEKPLSSEQLLKAVGQLSSSKRQRCAREAMQITDVNVILTCPGRNYVFVKVLTDEPGLYGIGEGTLNGSETIVAEALRHISHLLIGRDPQRIEDTWHLIYRQGYWRGGPLFMAGVEAVDL